MLHQTTHWMEIAGVAVNTLLLCRILLLRLHRVYLFITLVCVLDLLFDGVLIWFGDGSRDGSRVFLYSRFLYAFVYPMAAWDVFEEMKQQISKLRRSAVVRLVSGLFFALLFGLLMAAFIDTDSGATESVVMVTLALVLWAGSTTASFAFLLTIYRVLRIQPVALPNNTNVWMHYFGISFFAEMLACFTLIATETTTSDTVKDILSISFTIFNIVLTSWCIWKLRAIVSDLPSAPENARLS